ncbi:hypothetical protein A6R68_16275, partial [Neotoma lepida]
MHPIYKEPSGMFKEEYEDKNQVVFARVDYEAVGCFEQKHSDNYRGLERVATVPSFLYLEVFQNQEDTVYKHSLQTIRAFCCRYDIPTGMTYILEKCTEEFIMHLTQLMQLQESET